MTKQQEQEIEKALKTQLSRARNDGIIIGSKTIATVIKDMVDQDKPMSDIENFCSQILDDKKKNGDLDILT